MLASGEQVEAWLSYPYDEPPTVRQYSLQCNDSGRQMAGIPQALLEEKRKLKYTKKKIALQILSQNSYRFQQVFRIVQIAIGI